MSRKPNGKVAAERYSVRLEPEVKEKIEKEYGSLRAALEMLVDPVLIHPKLIGKKKKKA